MTTQERFAEDYKMPLEKVELLVRLSKRAGSANEHHCNGDPHPGSSNREDKADNSRLWGNDVDAITGHIARLVQPYGFTEVVYTGLYPTLKRDSQFIEIPY